MAKTCALAGADSTYQFDFGANCFCRIEEEHGRLYFDVVSELVSGKPSMRTMRMLVQCGLTSHPNATPVEAGHILDDVGGARVMDALTGALISSPEDQQSISAANAALNAVIEKVREDASV